MAVTLPPMAHLTMNEAAEWAAQAVDHWTDQEDVRALEGETEDEMAKHREREEALRSAARAFRRLIAE